MSQSKRNVLKQKASGVEHMNPGRSVVAARATGTDCNCKWKCFSKIPDNLKFDILNSFNVVAEKDK